MNSNKLLLAFGTRPEWIKIQPVVLKIGDTIPYDILFTGQHGSLVEEYIEDDFIINKLSLIHI